MHGIRDPSEAVGRLTEFIPDVMRCSIVMIMMTVVPGSSLRSRTA